MDVNGQLPTFQGEFKLKKSKKMLLNQRKKSTLTLFLPCLSWIPFHQVLSIPSSSFHSSSPSSLNPIIVLPLASGEFQHEFAHYPSAQIAVHSLQPDKHVVFLPWADGSWSVLTDATNR